MAKKPEVIKRELVTKFAKTDDIEVHISRVTFMGHSAVEVREFVVSTKTYGRGINVPPGSALEKLIAALELARS